MSRLLLAALGLIFLLGALSARAGYTWSSVAIGGGGYVSGVVYHPTEQHLRYARTDVGGAYRWDQTAARWIALNDDIGGLNNEFMTLGVLSVALDPTAPDRAYLACGQYLDWWAPAARLLRSADRGVTWTQIALPFKLGGNRDGRGTGERLSVDPHAPARLLLGTNDAGLWRSPDRGGTWTRLASFTPATTTFVLPDPLAPGVIYVGVPDLVGPSLWRSTDDGTTWAAVPGQPLGLMALQGALDSAGTLYLTYANAQGPNGVTSGAVRKLARAATAVAADWTTINPPGGQGGYCGLSLDPRRPGVVLVSTLDRWWPRDEIYYSENSGTSWRGVLDGAPLDHSYAPWSSGIAPHWITDVEIDPFDSARATFVTGFGLFSTANLTVAVGKPTWAFANAGLEETVPTGLVSPAAGPPLVSIIGDFDGFRHDDLNTPPAVRHAPNAGTNRSLDGAGAAPAVLARIHGGAGSLSRDTGATWTRFPAAPPTAANGDGRVAVSADGARLLWCPVNSTAYWSANDGLTWTAATGAPTGDLVLAADRVNALDFYVYDPASRRVLRSADGGASFAAVSAQLPTGNTTLQAVPGRAGELWVSSEGNGLRRLTGGGVTVAPVAGVSAAYAVGFGKAAAGQSHPAVFIWGTVSSVTGLYRSDDAGLSWLRLNDAAHQFGAIGPLTGDPRVFGRVYLGTSGRGIVVGELDGTVVAPEPQPSSVIYDETLAAGWNNWSWATVNLAAPSPTRRGTRSIAVTAGAYQALYLNHAGLATAGHAAVGFWIHGGAAGGQSLRVTALRGGVAQGEVNLAAPVAGTWTRVLIPLASLGIANVTDFDGLWIQNRTGAALPVFYLDDLALVGSSDASAWQAPDYASWRAQTFTAPAQAGDAFAGPAADPDGDGRANRLEWLLLGDPLAPDATGDWAALAPAADPDGTRFYEVNYTVRTVDGADAPVFEASTDLLTWAPPAAGDGALTWAEPLDIAGSVQRVFWRVPAAGKPIWFIRLR